MGASMAALSFEARLASANSAFTELCTLSEGLAPCVYQYRVQCAAQAIRDVAAAAYEQSQRDKATLVLCSAYLTLAQQDGNTSVKQQLSFVQQAFFTLVEADKQHASGSTASQYKACIEVAQQILAELDGADLDAGLSFWSRLVESIPRQWRTLRRVVSSKQAAWILQQGLRCMAAAADYKTGLKCGHEAAGPAELAVQCARFCGSQSHIQNSEKLKKDIWTFIWCTCESVQVSSQTTVYLNA